MSSEARADVRADLRRVADRLRTAPVARVEAAGPRVRSLLQQLADAAAGIDARASTDPPRWREVPVLPEIALGDQLEVLGTDLLAALAGDGLEGPSDAAGRAGAACAAGDGSLTDEAEVWTPAGRCRVDVLVGAVAGELKRLRAEL